MVKENSYKQVRNILLWILILNLIVALAKIVYGVMTKTSSMVADGYHSISDGVSNIVGIVGIWLASKPADENHPYGHQKFETLATIIISLLLFFVSFEIMVNAYKRFLNPVVPSINIFSFIVMLLTIAINIFITTYESKKGKELKSSILISDAKHTKSDIYVSISVLVSLVAITLGYVIIDTIISVIIAGLIIKAGLEILLPGINILTDSNMIESEEIRKFTKTFPEVIYCHKIRTRGNENYIMVDMHVGVDKDITVEVAHQISHKIQDKVKNEFQGVRDVIIHIEPIEKK